MGMLRKCPKSGNFVICNGDCLHCKRTKFRGQAIQLLSDTLSIPKDFIKSHCKITNREVFA